MARFKLADVFDGAANLTLQKSIKERVRSSITDEKGSDVLFTVMFNDQEAFRRPPDVARHDTL